MSKEVVSTPIRRRVRIDASGGRQERVFVRCSTGGGWEPLEGCRHCGACAHLSTPDRKDDWLLLCEAPPKKRKRALKGDPAEHAPVTDALEPSVLCVVGGAPVALVAGAMREGDYEIAVVVDRDDRPIGIIAPRDLAGAKTAAEAMTPFATTLLEDAPVARAIELAIDRGLDHVPVLSAGRVMGLVSPRSLLAWLTQPHAR